uniref:RNA-directed RNA polymerase n=1 Tax=Conidiobolus chlamydosporus totivirus 2 TaxID=2980976 RepID=A0A977R5J3_9VIRU|nr:RNA-dependent RNA polymerase [Conidiobolus chlamydosporus totivirus 2]
MVQGVPSILSECTHTVDLLSNLCLSELDQSLMKQFLRGSRKMAKLLPRRLLGPKWTRILSSYMTTLPKSVIRDFCRLFESLDRSPCEACFIDSLKELSVACLSRIMEFGVSELLYFLDLSNMGGFDTIYNRVDPLSTLFSEFGQEKKEPISLEFLNNIEKTISLIATKRVSNSFEQYVHFRDSWAVGGVSNMGEPAELEFQGRGKISKYKNKWFSSLSMTDEEIVEQCLKKEYVDVYPFNKKDEPAKARTVQAYDTTSIIRCSYMETAVANWNGLSQWTSVGLDTRQKLKLRDRLLTVDGSVKLCTDQSSFDINQHKDAIVFASRKLMEHLSKGQPRSFSRVVAAESRSLDDVRIHRGGSYFKWRKGLLSGCRWTAIIGSILNRAASLTVAKTCNLQVIESCFQGDDAIMSVRGKVDLSRIEEAYSSLGLSVNQSKTWHSNKRCEYLHEIYSDGKVYAFPARIFRALLWKKPRTGPEAGGLSQIKANIEIATKASRRGLVGMKDVIRRVIRSSMVVWDEGKFLECLNTPICLGGFGFGSIGRVAFNGETIGMMRYVPKVHSKIALGYSADVIASAIVVRLEAGSFAIPGISTKCRFVKVEKSLQTPKLAYSIAKEVGSCRSSWELFDYSNESDPYFKKLYLEYKLFNKLEILPEDVPPGPIRTSVYGTDKAYRFYTKWSTMVVDLSNYMLASDSFAEFSHLAKVIWAGLVNLIVTGVSAMYGVSKDDIKKHFVTMASWVIGMAGARIVSVEVRV